MKTSIFCGLCFYSTRYSNITKAKFQSRSWMDSSIYLIQRISNYNNKIGHKIKKDAIENTLFEFNVV